MGQLDQEHLEDFHLRFLGCRRDRVDHGVQVASEDQADQEDHVAQVEQEDPVDQEDRNNHLGRVDQEDQVGQQDQAGLSHQGFLVPEGQVDLVDLVDQRHLEDQVVLVD